MAIDRNIISWSDETKSFEAKSYIEIFNMLLENYRAIYGFDIDLTVETAFGEELRMQAEQLYDFAKLAEEVYYTLDVNNAKGAILDNIVMFTSNIIRNKDTQTSVSALLKVETTDGSTGKIIPGSNQAGAVIYVQDENNILWRVAGVNELKWNTPVEVTLISTTYGENMITPILTQLVVNNSFISNRLSITNIIYNQIGTIEETDEMLRQRKNNTLRHSSKALQDSIRDYVLSNIHSIKDLVVYNSNGRRATSQGVDSKGNALIKLLTSALTEKKKNIVEDVLVTKHDLLVLVQPQTSLAEQDDVLASFFEKTDDNPPKILPKILSTSIAQVLKDKITPGIATAYEILREPTNEVDPPTRIDLPEYISVDLKQVAGGMTYTERYSFYVANAYSPKITITVAKNNNYDAVLTEQRIQKNIYDLSREYTINKNISLDEVLTAAKNANLDVRNPSFSVVGIKVGDLAESTAEAIQVHNGYWLVKRVNTDGVITYPDITVEVL